MADSTKTIIAAILNLIIPGVGHAFVGSKHAMHYFAVWIALVIVSFILSFVSFGICFLTTTLPFIFAIVAAIDVYYEASGTPDKRLMKNFIK